jgi:hypothetical protein
MSSVCAQCSRVNPADAAYCYHDGAALAGRAGGPVNAGSAPFPSPFVFPDGLACRNFDQLAVACQQNWRDAAELLKKGFLGTFLGNMGRLDLARAAQEAADFPDTDRGLDQLLAKLPTQAVQAPKLKAEPTEINLGQLAIGADRATELHLSNLGMRLLYGSVASDCNWLGLGEAPGSTQKLFQFGADQMLAVHVIGKHLRAGTKPLEGRLVVESNGGSATVTVRAEVPIIPIKDGLFAGALTPRQVAEKAKANPKDAAPLFENGVVAQWYQSNGWKYPVQGPTMSGMGAIQQFFEALGVAKAPKLELATKTLALEGERGQVLKAQVEVATPERKPAYAWGTCDQPWVEFGTTRLNGRNASVLVTVKIPAQAGDVLEAKVQIVGNGNQKFVVPLKVNVLGAVPLMELEPDPVSTSSAPTATDFGSTEVVPSRAPAAVADATVALTPLDAETAEPAVVAISRTGAAAGKKKFSLPELRGAWRHLLPLGVLVLALFGTVLHDIFTPAKRHSGTEAAGSNDVDPRARLDLQFDYNFGKDRDPKLSNTMTFGLAKLDPDLGKVKDPLRLTFGPRGHTNNTVVLIDGKEKLLGFPVSGGRWQEKSIKDIPPYGGKFATFELPNGIQVSQVAQLVPGEPVQVTPREYKRLIDTCLIKYHIANKGKKAQRVGLRFLLDTYIADNDGVPFTLPGEKVLLAKQKEFRGREVPDFLQVLQRPDLKNPGLIMQLNFRISDKLEPPERVSLTHHPGESSKVKDRWEIPVDPKESFNLDSAVVLYWDPAELEPGKSRDVGFTYGMGSVDIGDSALVGLTVGGSLFKGADLTVLALVADPQAKSIKIDLAPGLTLKDGETPEKPVPAPEKTAEGIAPSPITWRVHAGNNGEFNISVTTNPGGTPSVTQTRKIRIEARPLF